MEKTIAVLERMIASRMNSRIQNNALSHATVVLKRIEDVAGIRDVIDNVFDVDDGIPLWENVAQALSKYLKEV